MALRDINSRLLDFEKEQNLSIDDFKEGEAAV